ncbi:MAG: AzlC family ABC transporter permease [Lachnospiraceae bacterium]|nr:AzlC family ABC transporter permease [Lachnospiraceae bacterium]
MHTSTIKKSFTASIPILAGYIALGMGFGILLRNAGYGLPWAFLMSLVIYGGTIQYVGVSLIAGPASIISTILTSLMINARQLFYAISMITLYKDAGKFKPYLVLSVTDETYSLLSNGKTPEGVDPHEYRFWVCLFCQCYWIIGGLLGNGLGNVLPFSTQGISYSMTALFVASLTEQWISTKNHVPALTGIISTLACLLLFGPEKFLIPSMIVITFVLTVLRGPMEHREHLTYDSEATQDTAAESAAVESTSCAEDKVKTAADSEKLQAIVDGMPQENSSATDAGKMLYDNASDVMREEAVK